uniref:Uncharacterized protein n=1 Tax=Panagrolaimus sp. ES5 TaxID=591445 RepID=A0AC34FUQ4_9BILA
MMWLIYLFIIVASIILLSRRYLGWFISKLLARQFGWKSVRLTGIGLFRIQNIKIVICNGFSVEVHDLRLSSSFVNQEQRKPIMFTAADLRVESELSLIQNASKENKAKTSNKLTPEKQARIMQWIQYVGAKVHTSNIVLLDALPGCLLHITFDNLCLETYLEREGLQLELKCKLIQSKLFLRKKIDALLLDVSLAGSASVDVSEGSGKLKKFSVNLGNPRIIVYDGIINYINNHTIRKVKSEMPSESNKDPALIRLLRRTPNINFDIDKLSVQFIASLNVTHPRRLSLNLQTLKTTVDTSMQTASIQFTDCKITDNSADSHFHCHHFLATVISQVPAPAPPGIALPSSVFQASVHIFTPFIVMYQHDLSWWINYGRGSQFSKFFGRKSSFEDDFSHQNIIIEKTFDELNNVDSAPRIIIDSELTDFQCQLRNSDSKTVVFGIDLATLTADHLMEEVEFGVESLWCHHGDVGVINERLTLDPTKHVFGTTVAIGAGLAKFIKYRGNKQLCIQLDECQFEWEEEVITLIVDFVQSIRSQKVESPEESDTVDKHL